MNIGCFSKAYPSQRLILSSDIPGVNFIRHYNFLGKFCSTLTSYPYRIAADIPIGIDGYHTINDVLFTHKPWCASFETIMPRGGEILNVNHHQSFDLVREGGVELLLSRMAKDNCKKLIALSVCNYELQKQLYHLYPEFEKILLDKTTVISVPQKVLVNAPKEKCNKTLRFIFVGNDFNRKGGAEIVRAFANLRKDRTDFELILITRLEANHNYAFKEWQDTVSEIYEVNAVIENSKDWMHVYRNLTNIKTLELIKSSDVGLLPTWGDTYGYSVLEFQAAGIPVITTNIRALPEINPNGWIINLPTNYAHEFGIRSAEHKAKLREGIINGLIKAVSEALEHKDVVLEKGYKGLLYIKEYHSYEQYSEQIGNIYNSF